MPRRTNGSVYRTRGGYGIGRPEDGRRPHRAGFTTKTEARRWFAANVAPRLDRGEPGLVPELTLGRAGRALPRAPRRERQATNDPRAAQAAPLRRHGVRGRAAAGPGAHERRDRVLAGEAARAMPLRHHAGAQADARRPPSGGATWTATPPSSPGATRSRHRGRCAPTPTTSSRRSPPSCRPAYRPLPAFAAATGLRPEEWQALERRDVDRAAGVLSVRRTVSSGEVVELGKTTRSRRQVPLSPRALDALDALPPRLDTPVPVPGPPWRTVRPRQLPPPRVGAGDRGGRACAGPRGSTTCAPRSPRTRSPPASRCSSWRGSWARGDHDRARTTAR